MWVLILLSILDACLPTDVLIHYSAIYVAGIPFNVLDWLIIVGVVVAIGYPRSIRLATPGIHPLLWRLTALFVLALVLSSAKSFLSTPAISSIYYLRTARYYACIPASILLGYFLLPNPHSARTFLYSLVVAGIGASTMIILFFKGSGEAHSDMTMRSVNALRTVEYGTSFATLAAAVLLFSVLSGILLVRRWIAWTVATYCIIGMFVTLTRSEWLAAFPVFALIYFIVPKDRRNGLALKGVFASIILVVALWVTIAAASAILHADFGSKMYDRVLTMLPGSADSSDGKAYDTRLPGMLLELEMWSKSPLIGAGFGSQYELYDQMGGTVDMRHCAWTSIMAETGLIGLLPVLITFGALVVLGRRLVRSALDPGTRLLGALGFLTALHYTILGMATMSFNIERQALVLGMICGMVLRARMMQKTVADAWNGYLPDEMEPQSVIASIEQHLISPTY